MSNEIQVGDFLYTYNNYGKHIARTEIVRETRTTWVLENDKKVKKDGLRILGRDSSFGGPHAYKQETEKLKNDYLVQGVFRKVLNAIDHMSSRRSHYVKDRLTPEKVAEIKIKAEALKDELDKLYPNERY